MSLVTNQQHRCRCVAEIRIETSQRDWNLPSIQVYTMIHAFASVRIHGEFYIYYPDWCPNHHLYAIIMKINEKFIRFLGEKLKFKQSGCLCLCFLYILFWRPSNKREAALFIDNWPRRGERNKFTRLMRMQMNMLITDV